MILVIDASGSMQRLAADVIGGFSAYVDDLAAADETYSLSLYLFDSGVRTVYKNRPPGDDAKLTSLTYRPSGFTALYDAVGQAITNYRGDRAPLVVVNTDGDENASREWTAESIATLVSNKKEWGWEFVFLGADIGTWQGERMGMSSGMTVNSGGGTRGTYSGLSYGTRGFGQGTMTSEEIAVAAALKSTQVDNGE